MLARPRVTLDRYSSAVGARAARPDRLRLKCSVEVLAEQSREVVGMVPVEPGSELSGGVCGVRGVREVHEATQRAAAGRVLVSYLAS